MWKETLKQLQTPRILFVLYSSADGRGRRSPVAGWSSGSPSEQGCLLPFPWPHGSSNPFLNFWGCFCSISFHVVMLLVSKEDKSSSVFNKPLNTVPLLEQGESHPPTSPLSVPTSGG